MPQEVSTIKVEVSLMDARRDSLKIRVCGCVDMVDDLCSMRYVAFAAQRATVYDERISVIDSARCYHYVVCAFTRLRASRVTYFFTSPTIYYISSKNLA
jgi:hypothetical protein